MNSSVLERVKAGERDSVIGRLTSVHVQTALSADREADPASETRNQEEETGDHEQLSGLVSERGYPGRKPRRVEGEHQQEQQEHQAQTNRQSTSTQIEK